MECDHIQYKCPRCGFEYCGETFRKCPCCHRARGKDEKSLWLTEAAANFIADTSLGGE